MLAAPQPLSATWQDMLVTGEHAYSSRSEAVMALTLAMVNARWEWPDYWAAMTDETNGISAWALRRSGKRGHRSRRDTYRRLARTWDKAVEFVRDSPAIECIDDFRAIITKFIQAAASWLWTKRTRITDTLVLGAVHAKALKCGRLIVSMSEREIVEYTGISRTTVNRSLKRLIQMGWLRMESDARLVEQREDPTDLDSGLISQYHARSYRLIAPEDAQVNEVGKVDQGPHAGSRPKGAGPISPPSPRSHDVWSGKAKVDISTGELRAGGLGRYAAAVYDALTGTPSNICALSRMTGMDRKTIRKHLKALADVGLAEYTTEGWIRVERDLDELAVELGVVGRAEEMKAIHRIERALWNKVGPWIERARRRRRT